MTIKDQIYADVMRAINGPPTARYAFDPAKFRHPSELNDEMIGAKLGFQQRQFVPGVLGYTGNMQDVSRAKNPAFHLVAGILHGCRLPLCAAIKDPDTFRKDQEYRAGYLTGKHPVLTPPVTVGGDTYSQTIRDNIGVAVSRNEGFVNQAPDASLKAENERLRGLLEEKDKQIGLLQQMVEILNKKQ